MLVTPEGHAFFSLGVTHTGETIRQDELGVSASRFQSSKDKIGVFFLGKLPVWGFNSTIMMRPEKDLTDTTRYETEAGEHTLAYYLDAASSPASV